MKPRKPLRQRTPLVRRTPLRSTGRLSTSGPLKARKPIPHDVRMAEADARLTVWARACQPFGYALCEVCGEQSAREYQHRKAKAHCSAEELWAPGNGLAVCGHGNVDGCHGRIHQHPTAAYANGWSVKSSMKHGERPVRRRGVLVWLDEQGGFDALGEREIREWEKAA